MYFSNLKLLENKIVSFNWITEYKKKQRKAIKYTKWPGPSTSKERILSYIPQINYTMKTETLLNMKNETVET